MITTINISIPIALFYGMLAAAALGALGTAALGFRRHPWAAIAILALIVGALALGLRIKILWH
jgi:hypothetical protein